MKGLRQKEKGLMGMDSRVGIMGGVEDKGDK